MMTLSQRLSSLPQLISALLVIGFFVLFSICLVIIVRRLVPVTMLKPHNHIAGFVFSTLGVIYGVMLAFVVVDVWEEYSRATTLVEQEVAAAIALYRDLITYPNKEEGHNALAALEHFTFSVVDDEFPKLASMRRQSFFEISPATNAAAAGLTETVQQINPQSLQQQSLFDEILDDINLLQQLRIKRLTIANKDLPLVIWTVVFLGGIITVGFPAVFGHDNLRSHLLLAVLLSVVTGAVIEIIVSLNFPFVGEVSIHPEGYRYLIHIAGW